MTGALGAIGGVANAQSLTNAPAAIGLGFTQAGRGSKPDKVALGMSMWFSVVIADADVDESGDQPLGDWSSCSGLNVTFNTEAFDEGGDYDSPWHMPLKITYGNVTLERAITKKNAQETEKWLRQVAKVWMKGDAGGSKEIARSSSTGIAGNTANVSTTVHIQLHSSMISSSAKENVVHGWTLRDAIPISYTGPSLSSKSGDVATEKLVIAHRGIESIIGGRPGKSKAQDTSNDGMLVLSCAEDKERPGDVKFAFNPKAVSLSKTVNFAKDGVVGTLEQQLTDAGELGVTIDGLRLEGVTAVKDVEKLMSWIDPMDPQPGEAKAPAAATPVVASPGAVNATAPASTTNPNDEPKNNKSPKGTPKKISLKLGNDGLNFTVLLKSVSAKYVRFTKTGAASRADVTLNLQVHEERPHKTNPTSGGRPGRSVQTVKAGDTLAGIALSAYGTPSAWRDIAEANGIDDPMRLPPGRVLFLEGP